MAYPEVADRNTGPELRMEVRHDYQAITEKGLPGMEQFD